MKVRHSLPVRRPLGGATLRKDSLLDRSLHPHGRHTALTEL